MNNNNSRPLEHRGLLPAVFLPRKTFRIQMDVKNGGFQSAARLKAGAAEASAYHAGSRARSVRSVRSTGDPVKGQDVIFNRDSPSKLCLFGFLPRYPKFRQRTVIAPSKVHKFYSMSRFFIFPNCAPFSLARCK